MVDYSPPGVAHIEQVYRELAQHCVERMGQEFLANVGTASAAGDMDMVRKALGDEQISYLGYSYGTELGTAYLERFGTHVRAMVLDGAIDPTIGPIEETINQMAGFQTAFNDYAADCARSAACPLGTDPAQWVNRYHALVDPLVAKPGTTSDPRGLSYADAITGTINALYTPQHWKYLTSGLLGLQRGTDAGDLLLLADDYEGRHRDGHYDNDQDAFHAIRCVDTPTPTDPAPWVAADRKIREVAAFLSYGQFTGNAPRDLCALWPVPATSTRTPPADHRARSSSSPPPTTRPRLIRPGWTWPVNWAPADHLRRNPAHRGVRRQRLRGHRGAAVLPGSDRATGEPAVLTPLAASLANAADGQIVSSGTRWRRVTQRVWPGTGNTELTERA